MFTTRLAWTLVIGLALVGGCKKAEFTEFTSKEGKFKCQFPGTPKEQTKDESGMKLHAFLVEERNGAYMAAYADLPPGTGVAADLMLDGAAGAMMGGKGSPPVKVTLGGKYPGRQLEGPLPNSPVKDGVVRGKIYIVGDRMYQMLVTGTKDWANSADATKFIDSLQLIQ